MLLLVLLAVTVAVAGFVVWTEYVPPGGRAMCGQDLDKVCEPATGAVRALDGWWFAVSATGTLALAIVAWAAVRTVRDRRDRALFRRSLGATSAALVGLGALTVAGTTAGTLEWDQLALWAVADTRFAQFRGLGWLLDDRADQVRFVFSGGAEIGVGTMRRHVLVTVGATGAALGLLALALWWLRPDPPRPTDPVADELVRDRPTTG